MTVTHFSVDDWGQVEQKTTPAVTNSTNNHLQNPFNPFIRENEINCTEVNEEAVSVGKEWTDEPKKSTNPFIDSNPFLGSLNPFTEPPCELEKKEEESNEGTDVKVTKNDDVDSSPPTVATKVRQLELVFIFILLMILFGQGQKTTLTEGQK